MSDEDDVSQVFNTRPQKEDLAPEDFDIVVDKKTSQVWILHGKPFLNQSNVAYAEYDSGKRKIRFVSRDGSIQNLGAAVQKKLRPHLEKAQEIAAILMDDKGELQNMFVVPLKQTGKTGAE